MKSFDTGKVIVLAIGSRIILFSLLLVIELIHVSITFRNRLFSIKSRNTLSKDLNIFVLGTFHNIGWLDAHIRPLANATAVGSVTVFSNIDCPATGKIRFSSPPDKLRRTVGQFISRSIWLFRNCRRCCPDVIVGYHIMPNALLASVVSRYFNVRMIYQMTSGPVQLVGGGYRGSNKIQNLLSFPSKSLERMLMRNVRKFDSVIVRGEEARSYVLQHRLSENCEIITAGIDTDRFRPRDCVKEYDLIYVSRLVPRKGIEQFLNVMQLVSANQPQVRAAIAGEGQMRSFIEKSIAEKELDDIVVLLGRKTDVEMYLSKSKIFMLLSESEGLSIAMLEAMSAELPVVVTNVGELKDFALDTKTGYMFDLPLSVHRVASCVSKMLTDATILKEMGTEARVEIIRRASSKVISRKWDRIFSKMVA